MLTKQVEGLVFGVQGIDFWCTGDRVGRCWIIFFVHGKMVLSQVTFVFMDTKLYGIKFSWTSHLCTAYNRNFDPYWDKAFPILYLTKLSCCILAFHHLIFTNGFFRNIFLGIAKHYEFGKSLNEFGCFNFLDANGLLGSIERLNQVSVFGRCYLSLLSFAMY